jgi:uncharacterized membrane protein
VSWFSRNAHWLLLALVAVTTVLAAGTVGVGLFAVLAGLAGGASLGAVLSDAALVLLIAAFLVAADLAFAVGFLVTLARRASLPSLPENDRVANGFARAERVVPPLARLGLSDRFAVSQATKRERLKRRYVEGDLTETEYERRVREILDEEREVSVSDVDELDTDLAAGHPPDDDARDEREPVEREREHS